MPRKKIVPVHTDEVCKKGLAAIKDALDALNGKWKLPIIFALTSGPKRFKELQRTVAGITPKILSKELKDLELNEFVNRTVYDSMPVAVEYNATSYCKTLDPVLKSLQDWGVKHKKHIVGKCVERKSQMKAA